MNKDKDNDATINKVLTNGLSSIPSKTITEANTGECQNCKNCSCQSQKILENIHTNIKNNLKK